MRLPSPPTVIWDGSIRHEESGSICMQRVCGLHSISVDMTIKDCATYCFKSPEALTGLGAGMGTKLFGNPASHSGDEKRKVHQTYAGSQGADGKVETTKARAACNCKG